MRCHSRACNRARVWEKGECVALPSLGDPPCLTRRAARRAARTQMAEPPSPRRRTVSSAAPLTPSAWVGVVWPAARPPSVLPLHYHAHQIALVRTPPNLYPDTPLPNLYPDTLPPNYTLTPPSSLPQPRLLHVSRYANAPPKPTQFDPPSAAHAAVTCLAFSPSLPSVFLAGRADATICL